MRNTGKEVRDIENTSGGLYIHFIEISEERQIVR